MVQISTRELLCSRVKEDSKRDRRHDPYHLALVIEGGGMRGVVAGGMVSALEGRGLLPCFDSIHGSSVGACAGAFFLAGQARLGTRIFYEDINNRRFIDRCRPLLGRPIMNTDFLTNHVMRVAKPLRTDKILSSPGTLHIITTDVTSGEAHVFDHFRGVEHFFGVLKATITMPVIAGPAVEVDGFRLVDGGMVQQIAVQSALGVESHILVLMTRKEGDLERRQSMFDFRIGQLMIRHMYSIANLYARLACTRFRRHRVRCFYGTGGESWKDEGLRGSSSLRLCG
jgi:predicted patatin/cPLA2 family phospholipase